MAITQSDSEGVTLNTPAACPAGQRAQQASAHLLCTSFPAEIRVLHDMYKYKCTYDTQGQPGNNGEGLKQCCMNGGWGGGGVISLGSLHVPAVTSIALTHDVAAVCAATVMPLNAALALMSVPVKASAAPPAAPVLLSRLSSVMAATTAMAAAVAAAVAAAMAAAVAAAAAREELSPALPVSASASAAHVPLPPQWRVTGAAAAPAATAGRARRRCLRPLHQRRRSCALCLLRLLRCNWSCQRAPCQRRRRGVPAAAPAASPAASRHLSVGSWLVAILPLLLLRPAGVQDHSRGLHRPAAPLLLPLLPLLRKAARRCPRRCTPPLRSCAPLALVPSRNTPGADGAASACRGSCLCGRLWLPAEVRHCTVIRGHGVRRCGEAAQLVPEMLGMLVQERPQRLLRAAAQSGAAGAAATTGAAARAASTASRAPPLLRSCHHLRRSATGHGSRHRSRRPAAGLAA